ncbi:hypothetical protein [Kitasatospora fiedleri]|uniref:hypothetical protein n=1 Tax=Kitasatospora fiedleri TaxID=2991545 RepID=UPI00249A9566|nr:hypothetical protein [Kitasatospora fiedleri]
MSITYFNRNTGDTAQYDEPNSRLEALDNWVRLADGEPVPSLVSDGVLSRPHLLVDNPVRVLNPPDGGEPIREDGSRGPAPEAAVGQAGAPLRTTEHDGEGGAAPLLAQRPADDAPSTSGATTPTPSPRRPRRRPTSRG